MSWSGSRAAAKPAGKAAGKTDQQIWADYDAAGETSEVSETLVPTSALVSVDLPALGRPTNDTKPLR